MQSLRKEAPYIRLELLYVHKDSLRKKGIATYYINKLVQYAKEEGDIQIKVHPNPKIVTISSFSLRGEGQFC
ncbi:GNAT family N-acetyltransferase [Brevibacterium sp. PAMC23299]|nr:GNAT family N-acetyltransferase [Brevibacterium sp. PAMC23299]